MKQKEWIIALSICLGISLLIIAFFVGKDFGSKKKVEMFNSPYTDNNKYNESKDATSNPENKVEENESKDNKDNKDIIIETKKTTTTTKKVTAVTLSKKDEKVIEEVKKIEESTVQVLNNTNDKSAMDKAKGVFISFVDFLFYDGKIKGVTFSELTESGKEKVLAIIHSLDEKIEKRFPGYKESISSTTKTAFDKASELIKEGTENVKAISKEKLGEENYNAIMDAKDEFVEYTKAAWSIIKEVGGNFIADTIDKIKSWYEDFREKNK